MKTLSHMTLHMLCGMAPFSLWATNVATHTITFSISPISEVATSSDPPSFNSTEATAGCDPFEICDNTTFYSITTNGSSENLYASLNAPMPSGTSLSILATAPNGATSLGTVYLDSSNQTLVTGITQIAQANLQLNYMFGGTAAAGVIPTSTRIVTYTLSP